MNAPLDSAATRLAERRMGFALDLLVSLVIFTLSSSLLWGLRFGSWPAVALSFVAPPVYAARFTGRADGDMAITSWAVTIFAVLFVIAAWRSPRPSLTRLSHISLAAYWFWSFALIGIGV